MSNDNEKLLIYFENEEHLVRRLGAAVVSCWCSLDAAMRDQLIDRAKRVLDAEDDVALDDHIERFLMVHETRAASPRSEAA